MKIYPRLIATIAACLFLASVSRVSAQDERVRAQVPFAFTVGQTTLPSGTYEVTRMPGQTNVIMVRGALHTRDSDGRHGRPWRARPKHQARVPSICG